MSDGLQSADRVGSTKKHRTAGIHVATVKKVHRGKVYEHSFLRQSYREGGRVRTRTLGSLQGIPRVMVDQIRRVLRGETLFSADEAFETRRTLPHGSIPKVRAGRSALPCPRPRRSAAAGCAGSRPA